MSFRVLYWNRRISVEFFHVLTDGTGGMIFLKALTGEYLRLMGADAGPDEAVWDVGAVPGTEEFENAFARIEQSRSSSGFVERAAVQMNGKLAENRPCRILHFQDGCRPAPRSSEKIPGHGDRLSSGTYVPGGEGCHR